MSSSSTLNGGSLAGEPARTAEFCCPGCRAVLVQIDARQLACRQCSRVYPRLGGSWCLVSDPRFWRALWTSRLDDYRLRAQQEIDRLAAAALGDRASVTTSRRINRVRSGLHAQLAAVSEHLQPLDEGARGPPFPKLTPSGPAPVVKCYENLFRDWSWGNGEAEQCLRLVQRLAPSDLGRLAVYGAGAGRLAVDVHTTSTPKWTVLLDLNPFPLLVLSRLIRGEEVTLPEFPVGPHSERDVVVMRTLRCAAAVGPTFSLAFADVLRPPFAPGSIDTVLTSWVIDALDVDFRQTARAIGHVLRPGGAWLNLGPLRFDRNWPEAYSIEEVHDIVLEEGFELTASFRDDIDYFNSPHSGSRRREAVFCFAAARRMSTALPRSASGVYPNWLLDPNEPIPLTPATIALRRSSVFTNGVLSLVDGKRSLRDVAEQLGANWQTSPDALIEPLRVFLARFSFE